ncbi:MAG TPA: hypothetical protein VGP72_29055 [Planctomycetota bacterium]|jgi:hypothetical protein
MFLFGLIVTCACIVAVVAITGALARWMLKPLFDAQSKVKSKVQYFITDIYVLILQMAITGLPMASVPRYRSEDTIIACIGVWVLLALFWWLGVHILSAAQITRALPRAVSLGITIPAAYISSCLACMLALPSLANPVLLVGLLPVYPAVFLVVRALALWAADRTAPETP